MQTSAKRGFTLIELLVVIAIIGILASVVTASLNGARQRGRDAKRITDVKQIQLAAELYYEACGKQYPATVTSTAANGCGAGTTFANFMSTIPTDPQTGLSYAYGVNVPATPTSYTVGATLEVTTNTVLNDDVDVTSNNVPCADPVYCVTN